jgi:hypothetical protein
MSSAASVLLGSSAKRSPAQPASLSRAFGRPVSRSSPEPTLARPSGQGGRDDADVVSLLLGCELVQDPLAELLRGAREALGDSAQLGDAVTAGTFERFEQPVGVEQQMTA